MVDFSFAKIAEFPVPDLEHLSPTDSVADLEVSRRRELLFSEEDKSSLEWMARAAEYFHDVGSYAESDSYSNRLGIAASEANNERYLSVAYLWQISGAVCEKNADKVRSRLEQLTNLSKRTQDPIVKAILLFSNSFTLEKCPGPEQKSQISIDDDWCNVFVSYKEAARLFIAESEIDWAIRCQIEYAMSKIGHGEYITSIEWIVQALELATKHNAWKWTGRLLQVAANAASDQGYRRGVEDAIRRSLDWCAFTGDVWGRIESVITLGRLMMFEIPILDPEEAVLPDQYLKQASFDAEQSGMPWLHDRAETSRDFLRRKCGLESYPTNRDKGEATQKVEQDIRSRIASRLADGISDSPDAIFVFDALRNEASTCQDFLNLYRNVAGVNILGRGPSYVALYSEISDHPYLVDLGEALRRASEKRQSFEDIREVLDRDVHIWVQRRVVPSGDGAVLTLRNVTAERQIEEALRKAADSAKRSERTMSEFLANMSHEIRTPINGVLGLARMLGETKLDDVQRAYVKDIVGSGNILFGLLGDILDMSKLEAGFIEIEPASIDIRKIVSGIAGLYRGQADEKGLSVQVVIDDSVPRVIYADGVRLRQILANLVANAVKFTHIGTVTINVYTAKPELHFEVIDTGVGIPVEQHNLIFDRFHQASQRAFSPGGTGLGLTISRRLVELMGGSIAVSSEPGIGSRFTFQVPLEEVPEPVLATLDEIPARFEGIRALLVEDNEVNMIVSQHFLGNLGCDVECAVNGLEAVHVMQERGYNIVFMDVRMPIMDGLLATREIRRNETETGSRTPIVALTAGALKEEQEECFAAGMDDYISKPFTDEALRAVLAKWTGNS